MLVAGAGRRRRAPSRRRGERKALAREGRRTEEEGRVEGDSKWGEREVATGAGVVARPPSRRRYGGAAGAQHSSVGTGQRKSSLTQTYCFGFWALGWPGPQCNPQPRWPNEYPKLAHRTIGAAAVVDASFWQLREQNSTTQQNKSSIHSKKRQISLE